MYILSDSIKCTFVVNLLLFTPHIHTVHVHVHMFTVGVYISKTSYVRPGERSLDNFYKPYHTVVYYRFLRFFPDGRFNAILQYVHVHVICHNYIVYTVYAVLSPFEIELF